MLVTYVLIFVLGCGVGAAFSDWARRRRQRVLAREILQAIQSGELVHQPIQGHAVAQDDAGDGRAYRRPSPHSERGPEPLDI